MFCAGSDVPCLAIQFLNAPFNCMTMEVTTLSLSAPPHLSIHKIILMRRVDKLLMWRHPF